MDDEECPVSSRSPYKSLLQMQNSAGGLAEKAVAELGCQTWVRRSRRAPLHERWIREGAKLEIRLLAVSLLAYVDCYRAKSVV